MERVREARRSNMAAGVGFSSRRRRRTSGLRDSPEDELVELRDRANRRERDRDVLIRNKRRRVERLAEASNREESTEESVDGEDDDETENRGSSSYSDRRKRSLSSSFVRSAPPDSMAVDEIVGVAVPRKARSSSVKRSHEFWISGNVSSSSPARRSSEVASPSSSYVSVVEKMKGIVNVSKSNSSPQEDIEIEIAEVLYGLMKQSRKKSPQKLEPENSNGFVTGTGSEQFTPNNVSLQVASVSVKLEKEVAEQESSRNLIIESGGGDEIGSAETIVVTKEESLSCPKLDIDLQDPTTIEGDSTVVGVDSNTNRKIVTSLIDLGSEPDVAPDGNMKKEHLVEEVVVEVKETKMKSINENPKLVTIDLEKEDQDRKQQIQAEPTISKKEKNAPPTSSDLTNPVPSWAKHLLPPGLKPIDGNTGTSKQMQPPHFSQPRTNRCTTHHYIARNICLHQQFVETNKLRPAPAASTTIYGAAPCNLSLMLPSSSMAMNVNSTPVATSPDHRGKDKSSDANAHTKQVVFQQAPQPAPAGNLLNAPAFVLTLGQNQAAVATTATQTGISKSAISINNASSSSSNSAARAPATSTPLTAPSAAMSFSYPNNGYTLPISTPFGTAPAFIGGAPAAQAVSFFNGSFYSPQMFHPSQPQQQQPHKKPQPQQRAQINNGSKHFDKQRQHSQQQSSKGGAELIPQTFTVSFASSGNSTVPSNINFSSMAQNPALFQSFPPNYPISEAKTGNDSKAASGKTSSSTSSVQTRTLNFMSAPVVGNWPSSSVSSTTAMTNPSPVAANPPNPKLQPQLQLRKQYLMQPQQQQQRQPMSYTQMQWKNSARNPGSSQASSSSGSTSKLFPERGQNQICFEVAANQSASASEDLRSSTTQQTDNAARTNPKSSPVCGRNVPSILISTCSNHLSELKY